MADQKDTMETQLGQLGPVHYDHESKRWTSKRSLEGSSGFQVLERLKKIDEQNTTSRTVFENDVVQEPNDLERRRQLNSTIKSDPTLAAAYRLLEEDLYIPQNLAPSVELEDDVNTGDLMTIGLSGIVGRKTTTLLAYRNPAGANEVIIQRLSPFRRGWGHLRPSTKAPGRISLKNQKAYGVLFEDVGNLTAIYFSGDHGRIQQLLFNATDDPFHNLLAIRAWSGITLVMPITHRFIMHSQSPAGSQSNGPSSLEMRPVVTLKSPEQSKAYADVCFCPWNSEYFATIAVDGNWIVWEIGSEHKAPYEGEQVSNGSRRGRWAKILKGASQKFSGRVFSQKTAGKDQKKHPLERGRSWYRIAWLGSADTLVICSRKEITIADVQGRPLGYEPLNLGTGTAGVEILDVKPSPTSSDDIFIVTSVHIFWLRLRHTTALKDRKTPTSDLRVLIKYRHYRDILDTRLKLHLVQLTSTATSAILYSRNTNLVTEYRFEGTDTGAVWPSSELNPARLKLSAPIVVTNRNPLHYDQMLNILFRPSLYPEDIEEHSSEGHELFRYKAAGIRFYQIYTYQRDGSVRTCLCFQRSVGSPTENQRTLLTQIHVKPPDWTAQFSRRTEAKSKPGSSFVVEQEDDESGVDDPEELALSIHSFPSARKIINSSRKAQPSIASYQNLYSIVGNFREHKGSLFSFQHWASLLPRQLLRGQTDNSLGTAFCSLASVQVVEKMRTEKLEECVRVLSHLTSRQSIGALSEAWAQRTQVELVPIPSLAGLPSVTSPDSLLSVYEHLKNCWITSLPKAARAFRRAGREKLARELALSVFLASFSIRMLPLKDSQEDAAGTEQASQLSRLAVGSSSIPALTQQSIPAPSSQSSSRGHSPTIFVAETETEEFSKTDSASESLSRLRLYAKIEPPVDFFQMSDPASNALNGVLAHWKPGEDPFTEYDYDARTAELAGSVLIEGSAMTAEQQRKMRKREDARRQAKEARTRKEQRIERAQVRSVFRKGAASQQLSTSTQAAGAERRSATNLKIAGANRPEAAPRVGITSSQMDLRLDSRPGQPAAQARSQMPSQTASQSQSQSQSQLQGPGLSQPRQMFPQSQIEAGRFAARRPLGTEKKKRKAGF